MQMPCGEDRLTVSVVIPYHNGEKHISRAIDSVIAQTYPVDEIIVVDDASQTALQPSQMPMDERIKIVRLDENVGGGAARNRGIAEASSAYVALLDCDDEWLSDKLQWQMNAVYLSANPEKVLFLGGIIIREGGRDIAYSRSVGHIGSPMEAVLVGRAFLQTSTYLMRKDQAILVGFDSGLRKHQDWDFLHRWFLAGNTFQFVDRHVAVYHRGGSSQVSRTKMIGKSQKWIDSVKGDLSTAALARFYLSELFPIEFGSRPLEALAKLLSHVRAGHVSTLEALRMTRYAVRLAIQSRLVRS
jgi:glycosyltransferase involved in cell wall biosynthesis